METVRIKLEQEHIEFLNELRDSGKTNMFGARPYIEQEFGLCGGDASDILQMWMKQF